MNVNAMTALFPVQRATSAALGTARDQRSDVQAYHWKGREEFVFLGYGQGSGEGLYNCFGRSISQNAACGATVDIYT